MSMLNRSAIAGALLLTWPVVAQERVPHDLMAHHAAAVEASQDDTSTRYEEAPPVAVSVTSVGKVSDEEFGLQSLAKAGLSANAWQQDDRPRDEWILAQFHSGITDATLRELLVRLLSAQASPPQGEAKGDWLLQRLYALTSIGEEDKVAAMIQALPDSMRAQMMQQIQTEIALVHGEYDKVCTPALPEAHLPGDAMAVFWQKVHVLCAVQQGKREEASVGLDVLHEAGVDDLFLQEIVHYSATHKIPAKAIPKKCTLLDFAAIRLVGVADLLKDRVDSLPPMVLKALAKDSAVDMNLRQKATLLAQQQGLLDSQDVKQPEPLFARNLAGDVSTLAGALGRSGNVEPSDNRVIARLPLADLENQDARRLQRLLGLMEMFGYDVPQHVWQKLDAVKVRYDGEVPPAVFTERLHAASVAHRTGEVILLSSLLAGSSDPAKLPDLVLFPIVHALLDAGLEKEARAVAYQAVRSYQ